MSDFRKVSEECSLIKEDIGRQNENKGNLEEEITFSFVGDAITLNDTGRENDILREEMDEETSEGSNDSGNVSEFNEDKDDNLSDGEILEIQLPPDEVDDEEERCVDSEKLYVNGCQEENQPVHIKIIMKKRTQKGKGHNFLESYVRIYKKYYPL